MAPSNLESFVTFSNPPPSALATSAEMRDRGSTFVGAIYRAASPAAAQRARTHHEHVVHGARPASHEMAAWRCMVLRAGRDGLRGPDDFELVSGKEDDGEDGGGRCILRTMENEGVIDAIVVVSRWFGGTLLGPVRFTHIETCTREVCRAFKAIEEVEVVIDELKDLDEQLARLRAELAAVSPPQTQDSPLAIVQDSTVSSTSAGGSTESTTHREAPDYPAMLLSPVPDLTRARRLVTARQNAIRSVMSILARTKGGSSTEQL